MEKRFNITGLCVPEKHYMVDISGKLEQIGKMIDQGDYFTINRARQFGKTTTLNLIRNQFSEKYIVIGLSFEGIDDAFTSYDVFCQIFLEMLAEQLRYSDEQKAILEKWNPQKISNTKELSREITKLNTLSPKPVILIIDEVDKSSDNQIFLGLLSIFRTKYLDMNQKKDSTFHSVILAGVYDVKNLKLKMRPDTERKYNSPWNIAVDFNVDMSFNPQEISTMLIDYENDKHTGMDVTAISNEIYKFTSGYPFLVSAICKAIDEKLDRKWNVETVHKAVNMIVRNRGTLIDDLAKNIQAYPDFKSLTSLLLMQNSSIPYDTNNPSIQLGELFSLVKCSANNEVAIHNLVFEQVLYNYFSTEEILHNLSLNSYRSKFVVDGRLQMADIVSRFQFFMHEEYRKEDEKFIERQGRLLFLSFLKPIINGSGFYYVEPQTRENSRMDLIVTFGGEEFVIELKIWRGQKYETKGEIQLAEYLETRGLDKGYLVTFDFSKNKIEKEADWIECNGKQIFEAVI